jgi:hypothetical protein
LPPIAVEVIRERELFGYHKPSADGTTF